MKMLSNDEKIRYSRQLIVDGWGEPTQNKIKDMTVFVAGAGGSGSPIITQLALLGVGCIRICDFDSVELSNLNRQFLHSVSNEDRIGVNKALSAKKTVENINPYVKVETITEKIDENNVDEIVGVSDIIFDSVDKIETKFILSRCALRKRIPHLFYGMMDINSFFCIFYPPHTPCFHCLYDYGKVQEVKNISRMFQKDGKTPTPACCPPIFLSAGFAVMDGLKILLGIGRPAYNKFYLFFLKGTDEAGKAAGYLGMKYWITDFFRTISLKQGFDWEAGWRNNFIEELIISQDQNCHSCSKSELKKND